MNKEFIKEVEEAQGGVKRVGEFLLKKFEEDEVLAKKFEESNLTLKKIWEEITAYARKKVINGCACLEDDETFGVAIHAIDESKPMPKVEPKKYTDVKPEPVKMMKTSKNSKNDWSGLSEALF